MNINVRFEGIPKEGIQHCHAREKISKTPVQHMEMVPHGSTGTSQRKEHLQQNTLLQIKLTQLQKTVKLYFETLRKWRFCLV